MTAKLWPTFDLSCSVDLEGETFEPHEWRSRMGEAADEARKQFAKVQGVEWKTLDAGEKHSMASSKYYHADDLICWGGQEAKRDKQPHSYGFIARFRVKQSAT